MCACVFKCTFTVVCIHVHERIHVCVCTLGNSVVIQGGQRKANGSMKDMSEYVLALMHQFNLLPSEVIKDKNVQKKLYKFIFFCMNLLNNFSPGQNYQTFNHFLKLYRRFMQKKNILKVL